MSTYREMVYMCLDKLKLSSDDAYFNEEHIIFLLNKYRAALIKQLIEEQKEKFCSETNYQTLCIDLEQVFAIDGIPCEGVYLRSTSKIPPVLYKPRIYPTNYFKGDITFVSRDRLKYVGNNKWLKNIIYAALSPDGYLYLTSKNPQFLYLEKINFSGIFEDPGKAYELQCCQCDSICDPLDATFSLEEAYIAQIIDAVVQSLYAVEYSPEDKENSASDEMSDFGRDAAKAAAQKSAYKSLNPYKTITDDDKT